jgi:hypothetical protein
VTGTESPPLAAQPVVSDHAMIRYLERVYGLDLAMLADEILDGRRESIMKCETGKWITSQGVTLIVKGRVVVTVIGPEE